MTQPDPNAYRPAYGQQAPQQPPWQPQQQAPWGGPPPQLPRRKSHVLRNALLGITAGVVALIALGAALGGGRQPTPAASSSTPPASPAAAPAPGIGQPAADGDFTFTLRSWTCGASAAAAVAGQDGFGETIPPGTVECIATMTVTDGKGQAQTFLDSAQFAYDGAGRQFSADDNGGIYLAGDQDATQVNPGVTITAAVPFQFPAGTRAVRLVLHDSDFSGGVTVRLGG